MHWLQKAIFFCIPTVLLQSLPRHVQSLRIFCVGLDLGVFGHVLVKTSLTPPLFIDVGASDQESQR
jgi:hypothetical protein